MFGFGDELHLFAAFDAVAGKDRFKFIQALPVGNQQFVFVKLHFEGDTGIEGCDSETPVVQ